jgi:ribosomal protein S6
MAFSNIANFLKEFAREFFKSAKVMRKIAINLETEKRNASHIYL